MKISQELKEYAARGMADKSAEFVASGGRVYLPLDPHRLIIRLAWHLCVS